MIVDGLPALAQLVEQRIADAVAHGEFSNLRGEGQPLELDDDRLIPVEQRLACRILKNAGYLPPELDGLVEINRLINAIDRGEVCEDGPGGRRLRALLIKLELGGRPASAQQAWLDYDRVLQRRLAAPSGTAVQDSPERR
jgi:hypothetical protein